MNYSEMFLGDGAEKTPARLYWVPESTHGVILVGETKGDWESPADALYPKLASRLPHLGVSVLRLGYRDSPDLLSSVHDTIAGCNHLQKLGVSRIGLVGHSMGGGVVIEAAVRHGAVRSVVALSTQFPGALSVDKLNKECALLLIHGREDPVSPPGCSKQLHSLAHEPRKLVIYNGAGHSLDSVSRKVEDEIHQWFELYLLQPTFERS